MFKNLKTIKRIVSVSAAAACMISALRFVPEADNNSYAADSLTAFEITEEMKIGWNIGNSLDATSEAENPGLSTETAWGNPKITKELIDAVKAKGFNTIRVPTTWYQHLDADNNIDPEWMARVHEVVDYCYDNDMYVILNLHHEDWVNRADIGTAYDEMQPKLLKIWQQIADEFSDYGQRLIFECMNEPRAVGTAHEWWGPEQSEVDCINQVNADFVELIRNDDSPYADTRLLMIPGYCAASDVSMISRIVVPEDEYVAVSIHAYVPYKFTMDETVTDHSTFTDAYAVELQSILEGIRKTFLAKDIPVVIGEFGTSNYNNTEARCDWAEAYISQAKSIGIPCVLWDNNTITNSAMPGECHGYINRSSLTWYEQSVPVVDTMMSILADDSIEWGSARYGVQYDHNDLDSGENLYKDSTGTTINASVANGNCTANYDFSLSELEGKEVAVKFTGDAPVLALMDSAWGNWTEVNPYTVDEANGIAYFSYDSIKASWTASTDPVHMCFKTMGVTTVTQVSIIDVVEEGDQPATDPVTDPSTEETDPTEETTEGDFKFEVKKYVLDLSGREDGYDYVVNARFEGEPGASIGGGIGYGTGAEDWINIEWSASISADGTGMVSVPITDIPVDFESGELQIWWSNVYDAATDSTTDYDCEMVSYEVQKAEIDEQVKAGDANLDGIVDINDAVFIMSHMANKTKYPMTAEQIEAGDVYQNGDGISLGDANSIQKFLAKMIAELPES